MSIIGTAASHGGDIFNSLFGNSPDADPWKPTLRVPSLAIPGNSPATRVDLSDKVKDILARASSDQDVCERLRAFVESHRAHDDGWSYDHDHGFKVDVNRAFEQLAGRGAASDGSEADAPDQLTKNPASETDTAFSSLSIGAAVQAYQRDNKEYITFSESEAAATSVTSSSDAGSISATSAAAHTASVTFVVDFETGGLSILRSDSTSVSTAVQINRVA
jgi:hypothetical protein